MSKTPSLGPEPTLISRKEMDMLYVLLGAVTKALDSLEIYYIVTGGSLLGAIRQASILFCDDDVDISILDPFYDDAEKGIYQTRVLPNFGKALGQDFRYKAAAWDGGDRVYYGHSNVFLDLFVIRKYRNMQELGNVLGVKANGQPQSIDYVSGIMNEINASAEIVDENKPIPLDPPFWHFAQRKAIELWPREVYRDWELWPLDRNLQMGPHKGIAGPRLPVLLLKRAFGKDCLEVYYPSVQHRGPKLVEAATEEKQGPHRVDGPESKRSLPPKILPGGTWQHAQKLPLNDEHFLPIQPTSKAMRRPNEHCRQALLHYLEKQTPFERKVVEEFSEKHALKAETKSLRPRRKVYMDGVFDLFHVGHLSAIRHCAARGDRVMIGVTGDEDAAGYKRRPIIPQDERCAIVAALAEVDEIICPCPLIVTEEFMAEHEIDLVVHGFVDDSDAESQADFFAYPMQTGRFERIPYYAGTSTTSIMQKIQNLPPI